MTTGPQAPGNGAAVTLREVYALLKEVRSDLLVEIGNVRNDFAGKLNEHDKEHGEHEAQHQRDAAHRAADEARRASMIRWAVTTVLSGAGVFVAIYVAFKQGG